MKIRKVQRQFLLVTAGFIAIVFILLLAGIAGLPSSGSPPIPPDPPPSSGTEDNPNQPSSSPSPQPTQSESNLLTIPPIPERRGLIDNAKIEEYQRNIWEAGQRDTFRFMAPLNGTYRAEVTELGDGAYVWMGAWNVDRLDVCLGSASYFSNGGGITLDKLVGGQTYRIDVVQSNKLSPYNLVIGYQKETHDISGFTRISDSIQYTAQRNIYTFTAPDNGIYRFGITGLAGNARVGLGAWSVDRLDVRLGDASYISNGGGITLDKLVGGQTYQIVVVQNEGFSPYTLNIIR